MGSKVSVMMENPGHLEAETYAEAMVQGIQHFSEVSQSVSAGSSETYERDEVLDGIIREIRKQGMQYQSLTKESIRLGDDMIDYAETMIALVSTMTGKKTKRGRFKDEMEKMHDKATSMRNMCNELKTGFREINASFQETASKLAEHKKNLEKSNKSAAVKALIVAAGAAALFGLAGVLTYLVSLALAPATGGASVVVAQAPAKTAMSCAVTAVGVCAETITHYARDTAEAARLARLKVQNARNVGDSLGAIIDVVDYCEMFWSGQVQQIERLRNTKVRPGQKIDKMEESKANELVRHWQDIRDDFVKHNAAIKQASENKSEDGAMVISEPERKFDLFNRATW